MKTIFVTLVVVAVVSAEFPPFVKICKRDPKLNDCLKNNMNTVRDHMKDGIPYLYIPKSDKIITGMDMMIPLPTMNCTHGKGSVFYNLDKFDVKNVNLDLDNNRIIIYWVWQSVQCKGTYKLEGKILGYDLNGGGNCTMQLDNLGISLTMTGKRIQKEDKNYIIFNNSDMKLELSQLAGFINFGSLFPLASKTAFFNKLLNNSLKTTIAIFQPVAKIILVQPYIDIITKIFQNYPIETLFPL